MWKALAKLIHEKPLNRYKAQQAQKTNCVTVAEDGQLPREPSSLPTVLLTYTVLLTRAVGSHLTDSQLNLETEFWASISGLAHKTFQSPFLFACLMRQAQWP